MGDYSSDYLMSANNRYSEAPKAEMSPPGGEHGHYLTQPNTAPTPVTAAAAAAAVASITSGQIFHPHHTIGHYSSSTATYIPGTG